MGGFLAVLELLEDHSLHADHFHDHNDHDHLSEHLHDHEQHGEHHHSHGGSSPSGNHHGPSTSTSSSFTALGRGNTSATATRSSSSSSIILRNTSASAFVDQNLQHHHDSSSSSSTRTSFLSIPAAPVPTPSRQLLVPPNNSGIVPPPNNSGSTTHFFEWAWNDNVVHEMAQKLAKMDPLDSIDVRVLKDIEDGQAFFASALTDAELSAHAMQLRVAQGIAGSTLASAVTLFTGLCYKLQAKAKKARERALMEEKEEEGSQEGAHSKQLEEAQVLF